MPGGGCGVERPRVEVTQDTTDKLGGLAVDKLLFFIAGTIAAPADPRQRPMRARRAAWPQPLKNAPSAPSDSSFVPAPSSALSVVI
jgi:hypothetical protein